MDADHRHELRDNDLMEFILDFKAFWSKWGNVVMWVVLICVSVFAAVRMYRYRAFQQHETAWSDLAQSSATADASPEVLVKIAQDYTDPAVRTLAYLEAGDLRLAEAVGVSAQGDKSGKTTDSNVAEKAAAVYRQAIEAAKGQNNTLFRLNAMLGLAIANEQMKQWDEARKQYQQIVTDAGDRYKEITALAKAHLASLSEIETPVVFAPEPPKTDQAKSGAAEKSINDILGTNPTTGMPNLDLDLSPKKPATPGLELPAGVGSFNLSTDQKPAEPTEPITPDPSTEPQPDQPDQPKQP